MSFSFKEFLSTINSGAQAEGEPAGAAAPADGAPSLADALARLSGVAPPPAPAPAPAPAAPNYDNIYAGIDMETSVFQDSTKETASDSKDRGVWREGMPEVSEADANSSKTVFMSQNLNKAYEERESRRVGASYEKAVSKMSREIKYFKAIMVSVKDDLIATEYSVTDPDVVLRERSALAAKLAQLQAEVHSFVSEALQGDVRRTPPEPAPSLPAPVPTAASVEYVFPFDKRPNTDTKKAILISKCSDCSAQVDVPIGSSVDDAMVEHCKTSEHRELVPDKPSRRVEAPSLPPPAAPKKSPADDAKLEKLMIIHKIGPCLLDDHSLGCTVCNVGFPPGLEAVTAHSSDETHVANLWVHYSRVQKDLIAQHPDVFGVGKMFNVTDFHTVVNKVFVDPVAKYAYCGICNKELPYNLKPIDGHVVSKNHDKLLKEELEKKNRELVLVDGKLTDLVNPGPAVDGAALAIDIAALEAFLEGQGQGRHSQDRDARAGEEPKPRPRWQARALGLTGTGDGKYACQLCDVRSIPNIAGAKDHVNGSTHRNYCRLMESTGLGWDSQQILVNGGGAATVLADMAVKQQQQHQHQQQQPLGSDNHKNRRSVKIVPHRTSPYAFYCIVCKVTVASSAAAFEHARAAGHQYFAVDGVAGSITSTAYNCEKCGVKISGEKNALQHLTAVKHKAASAPKGLPDKPRAKEEPKGPPASWRREARPPSSEQLALMESNGVVRRGEDAFVCNLCGSDVKDRNAIMDHIFSYQHTRAVSGAAM